MYISFSSICPLFTLRIWLNLQFIFCHAFSSVRVLMSAIVELLFCFIRDKDVVSTGNAKSSTSHHKKNQEGPSRVTLTAMLSKHLHESSTGEISYPDNFVHQLINVKKHHHVLKLEVQEISAAWVEHSTKSSFCIFHRLQLILRIICCFSFVRTASYHHLYKIGSTSTSEWSFVWRQTHVFGLLTNQRVRKTNSIESKTWYRDLEVLLH